MNKRSHCINKVDREASTDSSSVNVLFKNVRL